MLFLAAFTLISTIKTGREEQTYISSSTNVSVNDSKVTINSPVLKLYINRGNYLDIIQHEFVEGDTKTFDLSASDGYVLVYNKETGKIETCDRWSINNKIVLLHYAINEKVFTSGALYNSIAKQLSDTNANAMNLHDVTNTATLDEAWTWWNYPQVISADKYNKSLIYGWTDSLGYSGVSQKFINNKNSIRCILKNKEVDDHNATAILRMNDGRLMVAYTDGHGTGKNIHIRLSKSNRDFVRYFENVISVDCDITTTYVQMFFINNLYYIFSRLGNDNWGYIKSEDGENWSEPHIFLTAGMQYYLKLAKILDRPNMLRMCMYSNPTSEDAQIRMGFLDFENDKILRSDGSELATLSTDSADKDLFNVIIPYPTDGDNSQRMFDVAETNYADTIIAYCTFNTGNSNASKYYLYENGKSTKVLDNGESFWHPKYQGGISFIEANKIVLSRSWEGKDYIELWNKSDDSWSKTKEIFSEEKTNNNRNVRPIVDIDKKYIIWQRGYYNPTTFTDFLFNTMIYDLVNDKIVE